MHSNKYRYWSTKRSIRMSPMKKRNEWMAVISEMVSNWSDLIPHYHSSIGVLLRSRSLSRKSLKMFAISDEHRNRVESEAQWMLLSLKWSDSRNIVRMRYKNWVVETEWN